MLKRVYPHQTPTAAAKLILMQVVNNTDLEKQVLNDAYSGLVTLSEAKIPSPSPDPSPLKTPDPDQKDLKDLKKGEDRKGSVRGNLDFGAVAKHVISEMNRIAGRDWAAKAWRPNISKLLAKGFTQDDLMIVVRWKADEAERSGDWQWFKPDTLFRPTLFAGKLDNAKAGVKMGGRQSSGKPSAVETNATQQNFAPQGEWK